MIIEINNVVPKDARIKSNEFTTLLKQVCFLKWKELETFGKIVMMNLIRFSISNEIIQNQRRKQHLKQNQHQQTRLLLDVLNTIVC